MESEACRLAWNLVVELRHEVLQSQRLRAQILGFKISFVTTSIGLILANADRVTINLLALPAFAAIFFDLLINSYSISIKRIGYYCRTVLEPVLRKCTQWPEGSSLWEEFMSQPEVRQHLSLVGNLGITSLALAVAVYGLFSPFSLAASLPTMLLLLAMGVYDVHTFLIPWRIAERGFGEKRSE